MDAAHCMNLAGIGRALEIIRAKVSPAFRFDRQEAASRLVELLSQKYRVLPLLQAGNLMVTGVDIGIENLTQ